MTRYEFYLEILNQLEAVQNGINIMREVIKKEIQGKSSRRRTNELCK